MTQISRQSETETTPLLHKHADNTPSPTQHHQTNPKEGPVSPENRASLPSRLTLWWFNDFFRIGYRRQIQEEDLYQMLDYRRTEVLGQGLVDNWEAEKQSASVKGRRPSLLRALVWSFWRQYLPSFMWLILAGTDVCFWRSMVCDYAEEEYTLIDRAIFSRTHRFLSDRQPFCHQDGKDKGRSNSRVFSKQWYTGKFVNTRIPYINTLIPTSCSCSCKTLRHKTLPHKQSVDTDSPSHSSSSRSA